MVSRGEEAAYAINYLIIDIIFSDLLHQGATFDRAKFENVGFFCLPRTLFI